MVIISTGVLVMEDSMLVTEGSFVTGAEVSIN